MNLKKPKALQILEKLVRKSDVLIENFVPGTTSRLKIDYPTLSCINPKLIYCSISGYGDVGPKKAEPAFDQILQGYSGYMHLTGSPNGSPTKLGFAIVDVLTALNASNAILAALNHRHTTGVGSHIRTSLLECSISALINQASNYLNGDVSPRRMGNRHPNICPYGTFECKNEEYVAITIGNEEQFESLRKTLEMANLEEFNSNQKRVGKREEFEALM